MVSLFGLDPATYQASELHSPKRVFRETNCYVDLWIELLHASGIDPASAMSFACTVDFEGDQWTFFKPPPDQLLRLFGIDVHEMQFYRAPEDHIIEQLQRGRTITMEADSFYLPDAQGTAYRTVHVKSSLAIEGIDPAAQRLRYFHGSGYYELSGEDYRGVFQFVLPPYVEIVRFDAGPRLYGEDLRRAAREILHEQLLRRPARNPWVDFGARLARDLPELLAGNDSDYHAYAFATVRQCGAAFETAKSFVEWLCGENEASLALGRQVAGAKNLLFRLARRRAFDPAPAIRQLALDWDESMRALEAIAVEAACPAL